MSSIAAHEVLEVAEGCARRRQLVLQTHDKVLDVEVDLDERRIEITKDGRQKPLYLSLTDPIYSGALIERLQPR